MIVFGPWLPDQPNFRPEKAFDVLNVIPHEDGYHPWPSWNKVVESPGIGQIPLTMCYYISSEGIIYNYLGTQDKLYTLGANVWNIAGSGFSIAEEGVWNHTQFDDLVFFVNGINTPQMFNMLGGASFSDAAYPAGPPVSKYLATVRRFVVAANHPSNARKVTWSGLSEPVAWAPDPVTLADSQVLPTGGDITGLVGGDYGVIFQQYGLHRMVFNGPPTIFEFEKISTILGCKASRSIAQYGDVIFFLSTSGVKLIRAAQEVSDIGDAKLDTWLVENIDDIDLWRVNGTIDIKNKLYLLSVPIDDEEVLCDLILAYHWPTGEWSKIAFVNYLIGQMIPQVSYNVDTIDEIINDNIDSMEYSFDSPSLIATGTYQVSAFNKDGDLGHFNGILMPATICTGDIPLSEGKKSLARAVRPMFEGEVKGLSLTPFVRDRLQDVPVPKASALVNRNGLCPIRANGRYHRFKVDTSEGGSWDHALGIDSLNFVEMAP